MGRAYFHQFSNVWAKYEFKCRNKGILWTETFVSEISKEIDDLCELRFTNDEVDYIGNLYYMKEAKGYLEFLRMFKLNRDYIKIWLENGELKIVAEGPIWMVSMFEIYVLSIVNEKHFESLSKSTTWQVTAKQNLDKKAKVLHLNPQMKVSDFGTRRRWSFDWHETVIKEMAKWSPMFTGTSNVYFAKKYNLTPIGTMAHEFICLGQALDNVTIAAGQKHMLQCWANEYRGDLGIALSDTLGFDFFLKDFDKYFAMLFAGMRHDSGDPYEWAEKAIAHYFKLGINPKTKSLVFSDGLTFEKARDISTKFFDRANVSFGIGTSLTNDCGFEPLNIVFKLTEANGKPVAKLSDTAGKVMCHDDSYLNYLKTVIDNYTK
jgi:nicotinate phosphoribosyltransferase